MRCGCPRRWMLVSAFCLLSANAAAQSPTSWETFDFAHKQVDSAAIDQLSLLALRQLRGIVFGKHGRPFRDEQDVQRYLKSRPWYRPDTTLTNKRLSARDHDVERLFAETARRLRNEIFARHGRTFKDANLQSYFASQEWYHADARFSLKSLTPIERKNVDFILAYEARAKEGQRFTEG